MNKQEQYFLLESYDPEDRYAMIKQSSKEQSGLSYHLCFTKPIEQNEPVEFEFAKPYPRKPIMADHHYWKQIVFSNRVKEILQGMAIADVDYIDARITDRKGVLHDEYTILHVRKRIACFQKERSCWKPPVFDPSEVMEIMGMVLDMGKLEKIPLQERLIFQLEECYAYTLFHESVVDAISVIKPVGFKFVSVGAWHSNIGLELEKI